MLRRIVVQDRATAEAPATAYPIMVAIADGSAVQVRIHPGSLVLEDRRPLETTDADLVGLLWT